MQIFIRFLYMNIYKSVAYEFSTVWLYAGNGENEWKYENCSASTCPIYDACINGTVKRIIVCIIAVHFVKNSFNLHCDSAILIRIT